MINFKVKLTLKRYFTASYLRLIRGGWKKLLIVSLVFGPIIFLLMALGNTDCGTFSISCAVFVGISFVLSMLWFIPTLLIYVFFLTALINILKYCFAKFYYKQDSMEYFFNKEEFGWELAGNKLSYRVKLLDYIKIYPDYLLIQLNMKKIYLIFLADEKTISEVVSKLKKTKYKQYLK